MDRDEPSDAYRVYFGLEGRRVERGPSVFISPSRDRWNDFGFRTHADFRILASSGQSITASGFLGFLFEKGADATDTSELRELLSSAADGCLSAQDVAEGRFFTMLSGMDAYRQLVDFLGVAELRQCLLAINDVIALTEYRSSTEWLGEALSSDVFNMSFIRSSDCYFTFKNAGPLLRGAAYETFDLSSTSLATELPRDGSASEIAFYFDHTGPLPKRITVIIGKNGVGKSQTLGRIARAALRDSRTLRDAHGERFLFNRLLAFAPTNEAEQVFPAEPRGAAHVWYRRYSLNRARRARRNRYVTDLILQLARSDQRIGSDKRWNIFLNAITAIEDWETIALPFRSGQKYRPLGELAGRGEQHSLQSYALIDVTLPPRRHLESGDYELSSGEISFLTFAAQVCLDVENGSLLLVDEPETHLHPQLISGFIALLDHLLRTTGSVAILATHSVFVVREVFRKQVIVLRRSPDGDVLAVRPTLRTFGADPGAISYFVFGEDTPSALASEVKANLLAGDVSWDSLYDKYADELSMEFLDELRATAEGPTAAE